MSGFMYSHPFTRETLPKPKARRGGVTSKGTSSDHSQGSVSGLRPRGHVGVPQDRGAERRSRSWADYSDDSDEPNQDLVIQVQEEPSAASAGASNRAPSIAPSAVDPGDNTDGNDSAFSWGASTANEVLVHNGPHLMLPD